MKRNIKNKLKSVKFIRYIYENWLFKPIINLYGDNYEKNCLLSYSVMPFKQSEKELLHPNFTENYVLAESLRKFGYNIDVYNNTYGGKISYEKYQLIIGEGIPLSNYFRNKRNKTITTIYYATGSHPLYQNYRSKLALLQFYKKAGKMLFNSARIVPETWYLGASSADYYMILGNEKTKKTFDIANQISIKRVLNPPFYASNVIFDFSKKSNKDFLWFGSFGLVHKDLNTVIDVFSKHKELNLHICGRIDEEFDFYEVYKDVLEGSDNIFMHGYVNVASTKFKELMELCSFTILSSCSEGCSTSIATTMGNGGLIPIISDECGITAKNIIKVESGNEDSIEKAVLYASAMKCEEIIMQSKDNIEEFKSNYSINIYKQNVETILNEFLG